MPMDRILNVADCSFIEEVNEDLKCFIAEKRVDSVLVFPPVNNYRRFLIHRCVEELGLRTLTTFSIGFNNERRTVVCYREKLLSDEACAQPAMGLKPDEDAPITEQDAAVGDCKQPAQERSQPQGNIRSGSSKPRRPDRAVYVPRARRAAENSVTEENKPPETKRLSRSADEASKCPKSPPAKEKLTHGTPKKALNKKYCNVYKPPPLRNQRIHIEHTLPSEPIEPVPPPCQVTDSDDAKQFSDNDIGENFYIGELFGTGQLGFYAPPYYSEYVDRKQNDYKINDTDENMAVIDRKHNNIIRNDDYLYKDEDVEKKELKRASQEINRSSKRIIKQSFDSDVLVISDPVEEIKTENVPDIAHVEKEHHHKKVKAKLEPKASLKREENDWDAVFDESGECLDPSLLEELTSTVGKVHISKTKNNYEQYQKRAQALFNGPFDETFGHVVEVYDFPSEFKTNDLLSLFSEYKDTGFEIKWVDDTHALIVFSSAKIAAEVLSAERPMAKCRPLHAATPESRNKAKKCAEFLQPYRQRPETCTALARRLVSGALGVKLSTAQQERAEERRLITIAREKKRQAALHKEAAWDGSLANQSAPGS